MNKKDQLAAHYNRKYRFSDCQQGRPEKIAVSGWPRNRYEAAVYWGKGEGRALEIGAGAGQVLVSLSEYYDEYVATELSTERVEQLRKFFGAKANLKVIKDDIEEGKLDIPQEYFDTIIMVAIIEHLIDPLSVVEYCHSLLRPGGRLLIFTPNIAKWTRRIKMLFGRFPSTASRNEGFVTYEGEPTDLYDEGHLHYFTFRSLKKLLVERAGFKEVEYCGHGRTFFPRILPGLFSECFLIATK